jgi:ADP-ribose pyrophosphatase YjhB (NUDIX family)
VNADPRWLEWAKRLAASAQNGLAYETNPYNIERLQAIREIAAEMFAAGTESALDPIRELLQGQVGHATPKVDVRGAVFRDDHILLVRERAEGCWSLPGGWADVYDTPAEATEREIWEESGYRARAVKLIGLYDRVRQGHPPHPFHAYKAVFLCELTGGEAATSVETDDVAFFAEDDLPTLSIGRVTEAQIHRFFKHHRHPEIPTEFD